MKCLAENTAKATIRRFGWLQYFGKLALTIGRKKGTLKKNTRWLGMNATKIIIKFKIIHPKREFLIVATTNKELNSVLPTRKTDSTYYKRLRKTRKHKTEKKELLYVECFLIGFSVTISTQHICIEHFTNLWPPYIQYVAICWMVVSVMGTRPCVTEYSCFGKGCPTIV